MDNNVSFRDAVKGAFTSPLGAVKTAGKSLGKIYDKHIGPSLEKQVGKAKALFGAINLKNPSQILPDIKTNFFSDLGKNFDRFAKSLHEQIDANASRVKEGPASLPASPSIKEETSTQKETMAEAPPPPRAPPASSTSTNISNRERDPNKPDKHIQKSIYTNFYSVNNDKNKIGITKIVFTHDFPEGKEVTRTYSLSETLGKGGFGKAVLLKSDVEGTKDKVLKIAHKSLSHEEQNDAIINGDAKLKELLFEDGKTVNKEGIVKGAKFTVVAEGEETAMAFMSKYDGDMSAFFNKPVDRKECLDYTNQLLTGLSQAHDKGFAHGDLKGENILIRKGNSRDFSIPEGQRRKNEIAIHDWDGAEKIDGINLGGAFTRAFISDKDFALQEKFMGQSVVGKKLAKELDEGHLRKGKDIYATGIILREWFTGKDSRQFMTFKVDSKNNITSAKITQPIKAGELRRLGGTDQEKQKIANFINRMTHEDHTKRPTVHECKAFFAKLPIEAAG